MASVKIPEQKVILCGEFGVGKSSLFRRFMSDSFTTATDRWDKGGRGDNLVGASYRLGAYCKLGAWSYRSGAAEVSGKKMLFSFQRTTAP